MSDTIKGAAWKKRVSNEAYAAGWDRIFGGNNCSESETPQRKHPCDECKCAETMGKLGCICWDKVDYELANDIVVGGEDERDV